jgi:hypothetical protein
MDFSMSDWRDKLKADPTEWLLEAEDPPIRYWTLVDILNHPLEDPEVIAARKGIPSYFPIAQLLSLQKQDGRWGRHDYYLPRINMGTFWVLTILGDMGITSEDEHIRRASDFMFSHQRENGAFCRRRRIAGQGMVWQEDAAPCTHARIVCFLIQFGYGEDPRVRRAIDWVLPSQREDGMWFCRGEGGRGCLRATIDILRVAALDPLTAAHPGIDQAARTVCSLLMEPRMSRYHVGEKWGTWECLKYPYFGFSVISALDPLARLGYSPEEPQIANAVSYLISRQLPDGTWPADDVWPRSPIDFGRVGESNKWLTLDALRVAKRLYG